MGIRHILTQHEPVKGGLSPVRVVLIYVVYPLCRKLFSCIFLIPVKFPVKSNSGKIHSKVSGTGDNNLVSGCRVILYPATGFYILDLRFNHTNAGGPNIDGSKTEYP